MAFADRFRYVIAGVIFCSTLAIYVGRINLSTAIVEMAHKIEDNKTKIVALDVCLAEKVDTEGKSNATSHDGEAEKFDWDEKTQGLILGAFFWGYFLFQVPGGRMAETFGPKLLACIGMFGTGAVNLLTPVMAHYQVLFMISRVVLGGLQAMVFPAAFSLTTQWIPMEERRSVLQ